MPDEVYSPHFQIVSWLRHFPVNYPVTLQSSVLIMYTIYIKFMYIPQLKTGWNHKTSPNIIYICVYIYMCVYVCIPPLKKKKTCPPNFPCRAPISIPLLHPSILPGNSRLALGRLRWPPESRAASWGSSPTSLGRWRSCHEIPCNFWLLIPFMIQKSLASGLYPLVN